MKDSDMIWNVLMCWCNC